MARTISRAEQILNEFGAELGLNVPSFESYPDFTPAEQYIAYLAQGIATAEQQVDSAVKNVKSNADNALRGYANTNGVIQASGPLLDTLVAVLGDRRQSLSIAMRLMIPAAPEAPSASKAAPEGDYTGITVMVQDIFASHKITDAWIAALPEIVAEIVELVSGIAEATADAVASNG
jgi:hypothetical protein